MITKEYVLTMARYNAWQNKQITPVVQAMDEDLLSQDLGVFFSTILGTLNHLLWADTIWMSRFCTDVAPPTVPGIDSVRMCATVGDWSAGRFRMDGRMRIWAETLKNVDLTGEVVWTSGVLGREVSTPVALCVAHMFNHQTHHRGQVHAMLTRLGLEAPVSDVIFMPEEF